MLPHSKVIVPCFCVANKEPVLIETTLVQLGSGFVEKRSLSSAISLDQLEVATVKIMAYRDEYPAAWEDFTGSPIKHLVRIFPILKGCTEKDCACGCWHNPDELPVKEPILDVWRRQYLLNSFKPTQASKASIFSVCIRVPLVIVRTLLSQSGTSGAYTEPRTPDGKTVMPEFVVVWSPKMTQSELSHVMQTNPVVLGLARLGDRRGLRVHSDDAQAVHQVLRPEVAFLPGGPKSQYVVGPFPWGADRSAIHKALKQAGWNVKALQPNQPVEGRGTMWIIQSVESPPQLIFSMAHGEVVVSKHRPSETVNVSKSVTVGSASTINLCAATSPVLQCDADPWLAGDPWGAYNKGKPVQTTDASVGLQQLEERIHKSVLEKLPVQMDQDDMPERLATLENQVQMLITKGQNLEGQFTELSHQNAKQFSAMHQQIQQQSQTFHGQLENQTQSVQAMFADQMQQIRNLLSKRPREDNAME